MKKWWLFLLCVACPLTAVAQTAFDQVPQNVVKTISVRFGIAYQQGGMSGIENDLQTCYAGLNEDKTISNETAVTACLLYDISALELDHSMRQYFQNQSGKDPGPTTPYFADDAFNERMQTYAPIPFGDEGMDAMMKYFGDGIDRVMQASLNKNQ